MNRMMALVMAGGRGTRLGMDCEKPLLEVAGRPMIDHVLEALESATGVDDILVVTSPHTPMTEDHVRGRHPTFRTSGEGYVEDLREVLSHLEGSYQGPLLVINSDLPLVRPSTIDWIISEYHSCPEPAMCVAVPETLCRRYGLDFSGALDGLVPCGVNILMSKNRVQEQRILEASMLELAVNINSCRDLKVLEKILGESDGREEAYKRGREVLE
ncbi:TIGR00454 family protein [Methanothermobacter thermautotrophicus]|uniref:TIGR00454 family protein n=2 Tax=Methanothermobacter thermautotrophicus TaxID=145262 RepID=A0A842YRE6_METTF|nr:TIGR00454 family protein [Methanothermobacter thermautotrophicus]